MAVLDALAIYLLNLLLAFLQPRFDPSLQDDLLADEIEEGTGDDAPTLPSQRDDEFRPFVRRLPEWQFWYVGEMHPPNGPVSLRIIQAKFDSSRHDCLVLHLFRGI